MEILQSRDTHSFLKKRTIWIKCAFIRLPKCTNDDLSKCSRAVKRFERSVHITFQEFLKQISSVERCAFTIYFDGWMRVLQAITCWTRWCWCGAVHSRFITAHILCHDWNPSSTFSCALTSLQRWILPKKIRKGFVWGMYRNCQVKWIWRNINSRLKVKANRTSVPDSIKQLVFINMRSISRQKL